MTWGSFALLVAAGVAAGLSGYVAGLASLFSYPALLAAGLPPTAANVTNTVSLSVGVVSSLAGARPELVGQAPTARRLSLVCALGGATGAGLLLLTPPGVFAAVVPFLVGGAALTLLVRRAPPATARLVEQPRRRPWLVVAIFAVSVYGGYFGAAAGVLMLALLLAALPDSLIRANALKSVLLGLANLVAAVGFALFGPVHWASTVPLILGLLVGNWIGPWVARRLPPTLLRIGIGLAGLALAVKLGLDTF
ncbi:MAG TPA: sulfite exporter TauE/SafE family protein [Pseudonocardia sp.]